MLKEYHILKSSSIYPNPCKAATLKVICIIAFFPINIHIFNFFMNFICPVYCFGLHINGNSFGVDRVTLYPNLGTL